jgi:hypothetical protein
MRLLPHRFSMRSGSGISRHSAFPQCLLKLRRYSGVVQLAAHQTLDLVILVRVQAPEPLLLPPRIRAFSRFRGISSQAHPLSDSRRRNASVTGIRSGGLVALPEAGSLRH